MRAPRHSGRRHGLTLIETLVALVLLSGVAIATAALLRSVSGVHTDTTPKLRWAMHAERALLCVADDLAIGDLDAQEQAPIVTDGRLVVQTRWRLSEGAVARLQISYELDAPSGHFVRETQAIDDRGRPIGSRESSALLGSIGSFRIDPIQTDEARQRGDNPPMAYRLELRKGATTVSRVIQVAQP